ncbi:MAG TPA: carbon storage regulator CsrA [Nocardioidaceae bacterium]|nr:carbon storage regulator CsrA [Nocardioidaceae bacterium]
MLVLSRRVGESVVIGDDVVVTVLDVRGDVVRVGVRAPRHVLVNREELLREVAEVNQAAASPSDATIAGLSRAVSQRASTTDTRPTP